MINDLRFALRTLRKHPGTSAVAVGVLALGLAAGSIVFSLVYGVLLKPLAFTEPERLVRIFGTEPAHKRDRQRLREAAFVELERRSTTFSGLAAARNMGLPVTDAERPLNPLMRQVSDGYFDLLGAEPMLGRTFTSTEHQHDERVTILSYGLWQSLYGGDQEVVGQTIELSYETYEIIGVMPASYSNPNFQQFPTLWLPLAANANPDPDERANFTVLARLTDGVPVERARQEIARIGEDLAELDPDAFGGRGLRAVPMHLSLVEAVRPAIWMLLIAVGCVLLIACGNVANLLLARALGRQREINVRLALGAGRRHLCRQLVVESLVLGLIGCGLGLLIAHWSLEPLARLAPANLNVPLLERVALDSQVVWLSIAATLLNSLLFGLVPMRQLFREAGEGLTGGMSRGGDAGRKRVRAALVVAEIALSMMLLVGAGLMIRSFLHLRSLDLGFEPKGLLAGRAGARGPGFEDPATYADFHRRVHGALEVLPGVEQVGQVEFLPMFAAGFGTTTAVRPAGAGWSAEERPGAVVMSTMPGYFATFEQTILAGREFTFDDTADREDVAVISNNLARRLWGNDDPLGKVLLVDGEEDPVRIVGVADDLRGLVDALEPPPILFRPLPQRPVSNMTFLVRTSGDPLLLQRSIEDAIWEISRDVPVYGFISVEQLISDIEWRPRFVMQLLTGFALLALLLASSGIYAVLSYVVTERTREIGVRVAVGARRGDILRLVEHDVLRMALVGAALGIAGALALSSLLESQLHGMTAVDPVTYLVIAFVLITAALAASAVPALRATKIDPVVALRSE